jgi:hypothetical protein
MDLPLFLPPPLFIFNQEETTVDNKEMIEEREE